MLHSQRVSNGKYVFKHGDEASQSSESESEQSETEDIIIPKKVLKRKMLTRKRMVNSIGMVFPIFTDTHMENRAAVRSGSHLLMP